MKHIMLDLETLSLSTNARILQIAAVVFDFGETQASAAVTHEFNTRVLDDRGDVDPDTVEFWLSHPEAAAALMATQVLSLHDALQAFTSWYKWHDSTGPIAGIWANGATFDLPILTTAYAELGKRGRQPYMAHPPLRPWSYKVERCMRTMLAATGSDYKFLGLQGAVAHDALWDCRVQVARLRAAAERLGSTAF